MEGALNCKTFVSQNIGEMAEWLKAVVLKTIVGQPTGGSNPSLSATSDKKKELFRTLERWQSGRMHTLAKGATG